MALSGLPEGYAWATRFLYVVTRSAEQPAAPTSTSDTTLATLAPDSALVLGMAAVGDAKQWILRIPARPTAAIGVASLPHDAWHDRAIDQVYLDRVTGVPAPARPLGRPRAGVPSAALDLPLALRNGLGVPLQGGGVPRLSLRRELPGHWIPDVQGRAASFVSLTL